jgi:hypothetical protein
MRRSHNPYSTALIDALIKVADQCDAELINEFLSLSIDLNLEHLDLIDDTLPLNELIHKQKVISQGNTLLTLFNCIHISKVKQGLSLNGA